MQSCENRITQPSEAYTDLPNCISRARIRKALPIPVPGLLQHGYSPDMGLRYTQRNVPYPLHKRWDAQVTGILSHPSILPIMSMSYHDISEDAKEAEEQRDASVAILAALNERFPDSQNHVVVEMKTMAEKSCCDLNLMLEQMKQDSDEARKAVARKKEDAIYNAAEWIRMLRIYTETPLGCLKCNGEPSEIDKEGIKACASSYNLLLVSHISLRV